jgi:hypothetical protein
MVQAEQVRGVVIIAGGDACLVAELQASKNLDDVHLVERFLETASGEETARAISLRTHWNHWAHSAIGRDDRATKLSTVHDLVISRSHRTD